MSILTKSDFEGEDWFEFLPPSMQEACLESIEASLNNYSLHESGNCDHDECHANDGSNCDHENCISSDDHNCSESIDCCDAFDAAQNAGCRKLSAYKQEIIEECKSALDNV